MRGGDTKSVVLLSTKGLSLQQLDEGLEEMVQSGILSVSASTYNHEHWNCR